MSTSRSRLLASVGICALAPLLISGCGTRESHAAVLAGLTGQSVGSGTTSGSGLVGSGGLTGGTLDNPQVGSTEAAAGTAPAGLSPSDAATGGPVSTGTVGGGTQPSVTVSSGTTGTAAAVSPLPGTATRPGAVATTGSKGKVKATAAPGGAAATASAAAAGKQDTTPVVICQVGSFSSIAGPPLVSAQGALQAWVKYTDAHGGLAGHAVELDSKDDQGKNANTLQIVQNCVENEHAIAVVGAYLPETAAAIQSYVDGKGIPMIGGDGLVSQWYTDKNWYPESASNNGIATGIATHMKQLGKTTAATVYCSDTSACSDSVTLFDNAAKAVGVTVKGSYEVSTANPSFTSQCSQMQSDGIQAIYPAFDGASVSRLARDCASIGFHPLFASGGLSFDPDAAAADQNLNGLSLADAVAPWVVNDNAAEATFQQAMATYAPDVTLSESAVKGWTAGQLLAKVVSNLGAQAVTGPITSAELVTGLGMIKHERLGGLVMGELNFNAGAPVTPDNCWGTVVLNGGKYSAPNGDAFQCAG